MKLSYNKIVYHILLFSIGLGQYSSPYRFSLKSASDGEISFFQNGFNSNVVAEIKLMSDSLTWFGTGRGLSMHDGQSSYTYQSTNDSIVDVFIDPFNLMLPDISRYSVGLS